MQYRRYWHCQYILWYTLHQYLLIGVQVNLCHQHDSSAERVTPKGNSKPRSNPPNKLPYVPAEPDSEPISSDSSSSESPDSLEDAYYKQRQRAKKEKKKHWSKKRLDDSIRKRAKITANILAAAYKLKYIKFKLDEDKLQYWIYLPYLMNSLKICIITIFRNTHATYRLSTHKKVRNTRQC